MPYVKQIAIRDGWPEWGTNIYDLFYLVHVLTIHQISSQTS